MTTDTPDTTDDTAPAKTSDASPAEPAAKPPKRWLRWTIGIGGFVAGLVFGTYGEELIVRSNPGFFGPDNQAVIEEQAANFAALEVKLNELKRTAPDDPAAQAAIAEIEKLLATQREIATKKDALFKETDLEAQRLDDELRTKTGTTSGVDFWISANESMVLVDTDKVISVIGTFSNTGVVANLSGQTKQMHIGDTIRFETTDGPRVVIYRHAKRQSDGRYGFDLARVGVDGETVKE